MLSSAHQSPKLNNVFSEQLKKLERNHCRSLEPYFSCLALTHPGKMDSALFQQQLKHNLGNPSLRRKKSAV